MRDEATDAALVHLAKMLSQAIQISTHCVIALEEAKLLDDERAQSIARSMRRLSEMLDDPGALEPGSHAKALHQVARVLEAGHPS